MESIDDFHAPQYFDFCSLLEKCEERDEESSYFDLMNNKMPVTDETAFQYCPKRSSVLCTEQEINSASLIKHVFSDAFENLMLQSNKVFGEDELTLKQKSPTDEAYLYSIKSMPKTPKRGNPTTPVHDENKKMCAIQEKTNYATVVNTYVGMPATRYQNRFTIVQPFSFEARNEELLRKKQERLLKVQGENCKKIVPFHARPVPAYILSSNHNRLNIKSTPSRPTTSKFENSKQKSKGTVQADERVFKAKFPSVLYKEPFTPTKSKKSQSRIAKKSLPNDEKESNK